MAVVDFGGDNVVIEVGVVHKISSSSNEEESEVDSVIIELDLGMEMGLV